MGKTATNLVDEGFRVSLVETAFFDGKFEIPHIADIYLNRAVGYYLSQQGLYVVPNIRWGDERTYKSDFLGEKVAFQGVDKHSIVSI